MPRSGHDLQVKSPGAVIKATEFIFVCEELALREAPLHLRPTERKVMWTILQLHYGDPRVHYELQPQPARRTIELGLHFEGAAELNEARALQLANDGHTLAAALGPEWELEEWTGSWRRLHRTWPGTEALTAAIAEEVAGELRKLVTATAKLVQDMSRG